MTISIGLGVARSSSLHLWSFGKHVYDLKMYFFVDYISFSFVKGEEEG